jgi:hypothetical protein
MGSQDACTTLNFRLSEQRGNCNPIYASCPSCRNNALLYSVTSSSVPLTNGARVGMQLRNPSRGSAFASSLSAGGGISPKH